MSTVYLSDVIEQWLKNREHTEDCYCAESDGGGGCWYYLTPEQRLESRLTSLREALKDDPL